MAIDPAGQHYSPYLGMGNNPIRKIDPDGAIDIFKENNNGRWSLVKKTQHIVDVFHYKNGNIGYYHKTNGTMNIVNPEQIVIPPMNDAFSLSVTIAGAYDTYGIGYSLGAFKALDGFHIYATKMKPIDTNVITNLSLGLSFDYTYYKSRNETPISFSDFFSLGYEFSGNISMFGVSNIKPTQSHYGNFSDYNEPYEGYQMNIGVGAPAGFTLWETETIPLKDPISDTY